MLKILIVDDEIIIRTGLATVINWDDLDLIFLDPASSAEEAINRIAVERPHILVTDIQMNGKNGLQLAEEARELIPDIDIIILTGFDDFKYTQRAIQQHVNDYLLKTSRPDDIIRTILRSKQRIEERKQAETRQSREQRKMILERFIISGDSLFHNAEEELFLSFDHLYIEQKIYGYQVWTLVGTGWSDSSKSEKLLLFAIENICMELLTCEAFIYNGKVIVILPILVQNSQHEHQQYVKVIQKIEKTLRCTIGITVGKIVQNRESLHESFESSHNLLPYLGLMPQSIVIYDDIILRHGAPIDCTPHDQLQIITILIDDDSIALNQWVKQYINDHLNQPQFTLDSLEAAMQFVVTIVNQWLNRALQAINAEHYFPSTLPFRYQRVLDPVSCLFQYVHALMKLYHRQTHSISLSHVQKAQSYIELHPELDLSLQQVAKIIHIHPNHLSEIFKKEIGITFSDYLTKHRLKRAEQLLSTTKMRVSEVATHVGYTDVKYFSQLFKKDTGITPREYRELAVSRVSNDGEID